MHREEVYEAWCPAGSAWSLYVRPVLFAQMAIMVDPGGSLAEPDVSWAPAPGSGWALVIDLPGREVIEVGLALAGRGYRPVPVLNVCTGPNELIDMGGVVEALKVGSLRLRERPLPADALPAFLLDSRRAGPPGKAVPDQFDNRWQVFPQDFPSADALRKGGVRSVLLIQRQGRVPRQDLTHVLRRWQDAGLTVHAFDLDQPATGAQLLSVDQPTGFRAVWYRALAILGLRRNPQGGFGGQVPRPSQG
jgi:hypothetical protein